MSGLKARIEAVKDALSVSAVAGQYVALKRQGSEFAALCPFHAERTPSFTVVDAKRFFFCHGCGTTGDVVTLVQRLDGLRLIDALEKLEGWAGIGPSEPTSRKNPGLESFIAQNPTPHADPADVEKRLRLARELWRAALPIAGTPAEAYLRGRGLALELPASLRYHANCRHGLSGRTFPALVCAVQNRDRALVGVWRIYLGRPAASGVGGAAASGWTKANVEKPKLGLGIAAGGAVRLGPPATKVAICEGVETGLAIAQACPGLSVWPALSTSGLRSIELPAEVREVVICADNDPARRAPSGWMRRPGQDAAEAAAARFIAQGRTARIAVPPEEGTDWNDVLRRAA